jgi:hypothetical protein
MEVKALHLIVGAALLVSGCAHHVEFQDRIVEVDKPVAIQPIKADEVPKVPAPLGPRPGTSQQREEALLSKVCEFVAYALIADPLLHVSAAIPQATLPAFPECSKH